MKVAKKKAAAGLRRKAATRIGPVRLLARGHPQIANLDISGNADFDDTQMAKWLRQAAALPGWVP